MEGHPNKTNIYEDNSSLGEILQYPKYLMKCADHMERKLLQEIEERRQLSFYVSTFNISAFTYLSEFAYGHSENILFHGFYIFIFTYNANECIRCSLVQTVFTLSMMILYNNFDITKQ